ncbi:GAF domain-containing sensor histidine kinase [Nocardioides sp. BP30]|uniref:GAF domain-containing sensor histidine kinase n=1 Tax=Nocardioides sp. BP30 TaxID=3036374 RepID=UPI002468C285|nr:GAF domain-containing sensor histidine kinase [Nocardioides sp. BP30]WGL50808.1 GAF domain-containing sensor histidine kinase [Nocardioides sp. BP30]
MDLLPQLLRTLTSVSSDAAIRAMLDGAARGSQGLLPVDGAGIVLLHPARTRTYVGASDSASLEFERLQSSLAQGPCFAAHHGLRSCCVPDLSRAEGTEDVGGFEQFATAARRRGLVGVFAFPLRHNGVSLGALDLYRMAPGALSAADMRMAQDIADFVATYVGAVLRGVALRSEAIRTHEEIALLNALRDERQFLATAIHELSNSVASIAGFTWVLEHATGTLSERQHQLVAAVRRNAGDMGALAADILTMLSRAPGTAPSAGSHELVDLRTVVSALRERLPVTAEAGPELVFQLPDRPVAVEGDPEQLQRMLANVLGNAIKYTQPGGTVVCALHRQGEHAHLQVRDSGIGIEAADEAHVFQGYFRGANAREQGIPGSGLGLAIVKAIAEEHGGRVSLASRLGAGTQVRIILPLAHPDGPPP